MNANELRLGNFINHNHSIGMKLQAQLNCPKDIDSFREFEPIPLTEEWLVKFGFKKEKEFYFYIPQGIEVFFNTDNQLIKVLFKGYLISHIEFVHQLQNLYFSLTAIELTVA